MSIFSRELQPAGGIQRNEFLLAAAELVAIFTIFIIAFTGRDVFGDGVKQVLIALSLLAGAFGAVAGAWVFIRGIMFQPSRVLRLALGGFMAAIGIYTIVHVL